MKQIFIFAKSLMKGVGSGVGSGSGSISQRYGSGDPDPDLVSHQNAPNTGSKDKVCGVVSTTLCSSSLRIYVMILRIQKIKVCKLKYTVSIYFYIILIVNSEKIITNRVGCCGG
jgi:hypothetical protein